MQFYLDIKKAISRSTPEDVLNTLIECWNKLGAYEKQAITYVSDLWLRPEQRRSQIIPKGKSTGLITAGRGWGKTYCLSQYIRERVESGEAQYIALTSTSHSQIRNTLIEGPSGLLSVCPPPYISGLEARYIPGKSCFAWFDNKCREVAKVYLYSAEPGAQEKVRGLNIDTLGMDELAAYKNQSYFYDIITLGLRRGSRPECLITTTPRTTPLILKLQEEAQQKGSRIHITGGSSYDNSELSKDFIKDLEKIYGDSRFAQQEIHGKILTESDNLLFSSELINRSRIPSHELPQLERIVIAVDPAITNKKKSDLTGIIIAGVADSHVYLLEDASIRASASSWSTRVCNLYTKYNCSQMVVEINQGGDLIKDVIQTSAQQLGIGAQLSLKPVFAQIGKFGRFEKLSSLYESNRIHHTGNFKYLEDEMVTYNPQSKYNSPDRVDALYWAVDNLLGLTKPKVHFARI